MQKPGCAGSIGICDFTLLLPGGTNFNVREYDREGRMFNVSRKFVPGIHHCCCCSALVPASYAFILMSCLRWTTYYKLELIEILRSQQGRSVVYSASISQPRETVVSFKMVNKARDREGTYLPLFTGETQTAGRDGVTILGARPECLKGWHGKMGNIFSMEQTVVSSGRCFLDRSGNFQRESRS